MGSLADREKRRSVVGSMVSEMPKRKWNIRIPHIRLESILFEKLK